MRHRHYQSPPEVARVLRPPGIRCFRDIFRTRCVCIGSCFVCGRQKCHNTPGESLSERRFGNFCLTLNHAQHMGTGSVSGPDDELTEVSPVFNSRFIAAAKISYTATMEGHRPERRKKLRRLLFHRECCRRFHIPHKVALFPPGWFHLALRVQLFTLVHVVR